MAAGRAAAAGDRAAGAEHAGRIADRLFLSRRTVESHVANALRKLDGSSRRELASLLTDAE